MITRVCPHCGEAVVARDFWSWPDFALCGPCSDDFSDWCADGNEPWAWWPES